MFHRPTFAQEANVATLRLDCAWLVLPYQNVGEKTEAKLKLCMRMQTSEQNQIAAQFMNPKCIIHPDALANQNQQQL